jgi:hypothetical protein
MAGAAVADFKPDIDETARSFADQLLGTGNSLARDELQWSHASRFLENMGKMRRAQFNEFSQPFNSNFLCEVLGDVILDFAELTNREAAAIARPG